MTRGTGPGAEPSRARVGGDLVLRGARRWPDGELLDVHVRGGWIARLGARGERFAAGDAVELDAHGLALVPGLVDVHVHFRDPGLARKEGWERGSAGALHGGVTTVVEVQNNPPLSTSLERLRARHAHVSGRSRVDYGLFANLLPESLDALEAMAPLTPAFKCFLGCSTGIAGLSDPMVVRSLFAGAARAGRMIVAHCEDQELLDRGEREHPRASAAEHHLVRSTAAEVESIRACLTHVEATGAELHVFHLSTAGGAELVRAARARGLPVSASTAPHYLLLTCADAARLQNRIKVNPSVKTGADAAALLAALRDGTIDAIGTDHAPHPLEEKERPYAKSPSGMPSVDLLWPLVLELARRELLPPRVAAAAVGERAARSLHLPHKGRLEVGCHGDLVLFDPAEERLVAGCDLPSASRWSAYEGLALRGFPRVVVLRGTVVFRDGEVLAEGGGRALELEPPRPRAAGVAR